MRILLLFPLLFASLGNVDIVKLVQAGLSPETIEAKIAVSETSFDTSTDALVALANDGVPDRVIRAMIEKKPAAPAAHPKRPAMPKRRYEVTFHVEGGGKCEGELGVDGEGIRLSRCGKHDFRLAWSEIESVTPAYGFRGELVLKTKNGVKTLSTTTPAEAKRIVEHFGVRRP